MGLEKLTAHVIGYRICIEQGVQMLDAMQGFDALHSGFLSGLQELRYMQQEREDESRAAYVEAHWIRQFNVRDTYRVREYNALVARYNALWREHGQVKRDLIEACADKSRWMKLYLALDSSRPRKGAE